jgi:hypothetical protein
MLRPSVQIPILPKKTGVGNSIEKIKNQETKKDIQ